MRGALLIVASLLLAACGADGGGAPAPKPASGGRKGLAAGKGGTRLAGHGLPDGRFLFLAKIEEAKGLRFSIDDVEEEDLVRVTTDLAVETAAAATVKASLALDASSEAEASLSAGATVLSLAATHEATDDGELEVEVTASGGDKTTGRSLVEVYRSYAMSEVLEDEPEGYFLASVQAVPPKAGGKVATGDDAVLAKKSLTLGEGDVVAVEAAIGFRATRPDGSGTTCDGAKLRFELTADGEKIGAAASFTLSNAALDGGATIARLHEVEDDGKVELALALTVEGGKDCEVEAGPFSALRLRVFRPLSEIVGSAHLAYALRRLDAETDSGEAAAASRGESLDTVTAWSGEVDLKAKDVLVYDLHATVKGEDDREEFKVLAQVTAKEKAAKSALGRALLAPGRPLGALAMTGSAYYEKARKETLSLELGAFQSRGKPLATPSVFRRATVYRKLTD